MFSQNHGITQVGRDLGGSLVQYLAQSRVNPELRSSFSRLHLTGSWKPPKAGDSTTTLDLCPKTKLLSQWFFSPHIQADPPISIWALSLFCHYAPQYVLGKLLLCLERCGKNGKTRLAAVKKIGHYRWIATETERRNYMKYSTVRPCLEAAKVETDGMSMEIWS